MSEISLTLRQYVVQSACRKKLVHVSSTCPPTFRLLHIAYNGLHYRRQGDSLMTTIGITNDKLNLRSGPGTDQPVLRVIPPGTALTILSASSGWLNVQTSDGAAGYVAAQYIDMPSAKLLTFGTDILNVRSSPQIAANPDNKIEVLQKGATVQPLESDASLAQKVGSIQDKNLWVKVRTPSG